MITCESLQVDYYFFANLSEDWYINLPWLSFVYNGMFIYCMYKMY